VRDPRGQEFFDLLGPVIGSERIELFVTQDLELFANPFGGPTPTALAEAWGSRSSNHDRNGLEPSSRIYSLTIIVAPHQ
jgi:hypothetical protein